MNVSQDPGNGSLQPNSEFGNYRIINLLGKGGMGEVYEAEHSTLGTHYAIKLLPRTFAIQQDALRHFRREARVMANLTHPNILQVDDFGKVDDLYWLRMELAEGISINRQKAVTLGELANLLGGRIPEAQFREYFLQTLKAVSCAHSRGVIHRDLKPSNLLLTGNSCKVADFGLVKLIGEELVFKQTMNSCIEPMSLGGENTLQPETGSSTRALIGTYEYMSPEQKRGEEADVRSDIYALGLIAYRMLSGYTNLSRERLVDIDSKLPPVWDSILDKTLAEKPERRFQHVDEIISHLNTSKPAQSAVCTEKPPPNEAPSPLQTAPAFPQPNPSRGIRTEPAQQKLSGTVRYLRAVILFMISCFWGIGSIGTPIASKFF